MINLILKEDDIIPGTKTIVVSPDPEKMHPVLFFSVGGHGWEDAETVEDGFRIAIRKSQELIHKVN